MAASSSVRVRAGGPGLALAAAAKPRAALRARWRAQPRQVAFERSQSASLEHAHAIYFTNGAGDVTAAARLCARGYGVLGGEARQV
jgi:hypothetical protein